MSEGAPAGGWEQVALELDRTPGDRTVRFLDDRLDTALVAQTGQADSESLALVLRDPGGRLVAGLHGLTWGGCCELLTLWVDEAHRNQGLATRLLGHAEEEARRRGCTQMVLFTHSSRPPDLYLRLGYEVAGVVPDYPRGSAAYWLRAPIRDSARTVPFTPSGGCSRRIADATMPTVSA